MALARQQPDALALARDDQGVAVVARTHAAVGAGRDLQEGRWRVRFPSGNCASRSAPPHRTAPAAPHRATKEIFYGGFGPVLAGGLLAGAVIGGIASSAYAWGPGYYEAPMCRGFGRLAVGELDRVDSLDHRTWCRMMRDRGRCAYPPLAIASFALVVPKTRAAPPGSSRPILPAGVNSQSFNTSLSGYCA
jgi:hypothetical protein